MPPLSGITVLEFAGLAPGPFCGMMLNDFGANVIRVDKIASGTTDVLARGKRSISLNIKSDKARKLLLDYILRDNVDVLIDPFRPGIMEKLGLGPDQVLAINPKIIYARMTGWGQTGDFSAMAGHDINYIGLSGALSVIGREGENPIFPGNILGDFAGGGMLCCMGILMALFERSKTGKGQIVDAAMIDGAAYLSSFIYKMKHNGMWNEAMGKNTLDSGAPFYEVYKTKDNLYMAVGAIEPQFYRLLIKGLGLDEIKDSLPHQMDTMTWPETKKRFARIFESKTRHEWQTIFNGTDACVTPVLEMSDASGIGQDVMSVSHNRQRNILVQDPESGGHYEPSPAPRLSNYKINNGFKVKRQPAVGEHTVEILKEFKVPQLVIDSMLADKVVMDMSLSSSSKL